MRQIDMQRQLAPAQISASTLRLTWWRLVSDLAQEIAERTLRHAAAEMRAKRPKYCPDVFHSMAVDRQAAHDNNAAALLDLVEYPFEVIVKCRVATVLGVDFS
jgi:hypothetical protein